MAQIALAWLLHRPAVASVILGARTLDQLDDNLAAADIHLTEKDTARLDGASDPEAADYPYGGPAIKTLAKAAATSTIAAKAARRRVNSTGATTRAPWS
jgi:diketogulonate reductase-like aldo/keto reductase